MSSYIDTNDCQGRLRADYSSLYDLPGEADDLGDDIEAAEMLVDASVGKRYATPVTSATAIKFLKVIALDLFEEIAWARGIGDELPKKVARKADNARKTLEKIAKGAITLGGATALTERQTGGADAIIVEGNDPEFTRDQMEGF